MTQNKVTSEQLDEILAKSEVQYFKHVETITTVVVKLPNGFTLMGRSAYTDPTDPNGTLGEEMALEQVKNKLVEMEGYKRLAGSN